jgi:hypothetical protein
MTTARELITQSLRTLGVLHSGETPSAEEANDGLTSLNQMLNAWIYDGIDMEFSTLTSLNDVIGYPDDQIGPIRYNLAVVMSPDYGVPITPAMVALAQQGYLQMKRAYLSIPTLSVDSALSPAYNPNSVY